MCTSFWKQDTGSRVDFTTNQAIPAVHRFHFAFTACSNTSMLGPDPRLILHTCESIRIIPSMVYTQRFVLYTLWQIVTSKWPILVKDAKLEGMNAEGEFNECSHSSDKNKADIFITSDVTMRNTSCCNRWRELRIFLVFYSSFGAYLLLSHHFPLPKAREAAILNFERHYTDEKPHRLFSADDIGVNFGSTHSECDCPMEAWRLKQHLNLSLPCPCRTEHRDSSGNVVHGRPFHVNWTSVQSKFKLSSRGRKTFQRNTTILCSNSLQNGQLPKERILQLQKRFPGHQFLVHEQLLSRDVKNLMSGTLGVNSLESHSDTIVGVLDNAFRSDSRILWLDPFVHNNHLFQVSEMLTEGRLHDGLPTSSNDKDTLLVFDQTSFFGILPPNLDQNPYLLLTKKESIRNLLWWLTLCQLHKDCVHQLDMPASGKCPWENSVFMSLISLHV